MKKPLVIALVILGIVVLLGTCAGIAVPAFRKYMERSRGSSGSSALGHAGSAVALMHPPYTDTATGPRAPRGVSA